MGADSVIYIRTDGNSKISTGHLVRCISIAQALLDQDRKVCFLVSDEESLSLLESFWKDQTQNITQKKEALWGSHASALVLATARYDQPENELAELLSLFDVPKSTSGLLPSFSESSANLSSDSYNDSDMPIILIDSYFVTPAYLNALNKVARTAYIDDLKKFDYPVDLLLNYDIISPKELPKLQSFYTSAKFLLPGAEYTPLRRQFSSYTPVFREIPQNVLITSGGSDPYGFCLKLLTALQGRYFSSGTARPSSYDDALSTGNLYPSASGILSQEEWPSLTFHVVMGKLFSPEEKQSLHSLASTRKNIQLHEGLTDLAPLMKKCDLAISAAGTTLCELSALGVPAISFTMADNQVEFALGFDRAGAIPYAGDIRDEDSNGAYIENIRDEDSNGAYIENIRDEDSNGAYIGDIRDKHSDKVYERIMDFLASMLENPEKRKLLQNKSRSLIDGKGSSRIAEALCRL